MYMCIYIYIYSCVLLLLLLIIIFTSARRLAGVPLGELRALLVAVLRELCQPDTYAIMCMYIYIYV